MALTRISHSLRTPWLDLCSIRSFSILADTSCIGCGLKSPAETNLCAIIVRSCEKYGLNRIRTEVTGRMWNHACGALAKANRALIRSNSWSRTAR